MTGNGNSALAPIWAMLREEVQQPEYWKKWKQGWDTTKLLLTEPPETQAEFVVAAVRRTLLSRQTPVDYFSAFGRLLSRVMTAPHAQLATLVVSPRTISLDQMSGREKEHHIEERVNYAATGVVNELVRHRVALSDVQMVHLLELYAPAPRWPSQPLLNYLLRLAEKSRQSPETRGALEKLRRGLLELRAHREQREQLEKIAKLLEDVPAYQAARGPWLEMVLKEVDSLPESDLWRCVLTHAEASGATPSKRWQEESAKLIASLSRERFREMALRWLGGGVTPGEARRQLRPGEAELLKGFVWMLCEFADLQVAGCLAALAEECFRKIPQIGAVSHKVGNACVNVLAAIPGLNAVGQLSRLRARVKYSTAKRLVEKALDEAAKGAGLTRHDLEDIAVPTFDLDVPGVLRRETGEYTAELAIVGSVQLALSWRSAKGKASKSIPAAVKRSHSEVLKTLRRTAKDAEQMLRAQRLRLEKIFLSEHSARYEDWRKRTVEHPLLAQMTRRLIWQFEDSSARKTLGIWKADGLVGADGKVLRNLEGTAVRLWHPLGTDVKTVLAWRNWLREREITQPFKQAHREIYVLTDAERQTETYSNRFAAHILSQHALNALCRERGWENRLQGQFDSGGATPTLNLPEQGLVVEFWVEAPPDAPTSAAGISLYVATDQVRFCDAHRVPVALERIPPLVFSEVMRDVDLFVGVTSIANDPSWFDQGEGTPFTGYWHAWSFAELSATALMRREILQELLPKLKIGERCKIEDKFLVVRGERATYKIHLGSGNILMEPGSKYLCIVAGRSIHLSGGGKAPLRILLPFEGDGMLAIILSKAFLLAEDEKITDPTILRQLPS
jgi:hypothetical protein